MAYGAILRNADGDDVLDFNRALYLKATGTTINWTDLLAQASADLDAQGVGNGFGDRTRALVSDIFYLTTQGQNFATSFFVANGGAGARFGAKGVVYADPAMDPEDLAFLQLTAGVTLHQMVTANMVFPNLPQGAVTYVVASAAQAFRIASTDVPGFTPSGSHGMILRDATGAVTYDSRYPQLSVVHRALVPKATCENILMNDASVEITLPVAAPDVFVCIPYFTAFIHRYNSGPRTFNRSVISVEQTSPTKVTLTRTGSWTGGSWTRRYTQDLWFIFAR